MHVAGRPGQKIISRHGSTGIDLNIITSLIINIRIIVNLISIAIALTFSSHLFVSSDALNTFHLVKVNHEHPGVDPITMVAALDAIFIVNPNHCLRKPQRSKGKNGAELQAQAFPNS